MVTLLLKSRDNFRCLLLKVSGVDWVMRMLMDGIAASLRFIAELKGDLRKMAVNLVPFSRMHSFLLAQSRLFAENQTGKAKLTMQEIEGGNKLVAHAQYEEALMRVRATTLRRC